MKKKHFKIGTRSSPLALAQTLEARSYLMKEHNISEQDFEIIPISTKGDRITDIGLNEIGGKGLFTEDIERKLQSGEIDFAVHSAKDMPTKLLKGLQISAYLPRGDIRDVLISHNSQCLNDLSKKSVIGTSSVRRKALLSRCRPDISTINFRGNIETRLHKLTNKHADAIIIAYAGVKRLQKENFITEILNPKYFPPAPAQGAICIETYIDNTKAHELASNVNHSETWDAVNCERAFLAELDGSCSSAIAGFASCDGEKISFYGIVLSPDGKIFYEVSRNGKRCDAINIGSNAGKYIRSIDDKKILSHNI